MFSESISLPAIHPWVLLGLYVITLAGVWRRGRFFRAFVAVLFGVICLICWGLFGSRDDLLGLVALVFECITAVHFLRLASPHLRTLPYRALVSIPAHWFAASTLLAFPFALLGAFGLPTTGAVVAYLLGLVGVWQSLSAPRETVDLVLDDVDAGPLRPYPRVAPVALDRAGRSSEPAGGLRIVQITDPHLGPFMSPERLNAICARAVDLDPDLVFITGDLLTMESHGAVDAVADAFAPLGALPGRVFACHGNHDHEDRETVREGLTRAGATLLIDEAVRVDTRLGPVDVIGSDFHWNDRSARLDHLLQSLGPRDGTPRLLLLHHPGAFDDLPLDSVDLAFSGHTHGGHLGLLSLGSDWTVVRAATDIPDHGLWARGRSRLYVHRGNGHYGFPLRLGVPAEESLLRVSFSGTGFGN